MTTSTARPACVNDLRELARALVPGHIWDYVDGGAGEEHTVRANEEAFRRLALVPRVLVDVSRRDLRTTALGQQVAAPVGVAPTSYHRLMHVDGELATVRAAGAEGLLSIVSTFSSRPLEEIAGAATGPLWLQLYCFRDRSFTRELVERAAAAGYRGLVLTVDAAMFGYRDRDIRNGFRLPPHVTPANLPVNGWHRGGSGDVELTELNQALVEPGLTWDDIEWIRGLSELPLVLKGILAEPDAARAADLDVRGVLVSNHGGRQVDGAVAAMTALPGVVQAVQGRCEVYVDGGVRRGGHLVKALAAGARMAFVGRPVLWGLAADGEAGVREVLRMYTEELELTMAACGCPTVAHIGPDLLHDPR